MLPELLDAAAWHRNWSGKVVKMGLGERLLAGDEVGNSEEGGMLARPNIPTDEAPLNPPPK